MIYPEYLNHTLYYRMKDIVASVFLLYTCRNVGEREREKCIVFVSRRKTICIITE